MSKQYIAVHEKINIFNFMAWMDQRKQLSFVTKNGVPVIVDADIVGWQITIDNNQHHNLSAHEVIGHFIKHEIGYFA